MKYIKTYEQSTVIFKKIINDAQKIQPPKYKKYQYSRTTSWRRLQSVSNMLNFKSLLEELLLNKRVSIIEHFGDRTNIIVKKIKIRDENFLDLYSIEKLYMVSASTVITIYYENYPEKGPIELEAEIVFDANKFNI